MFNRKYIDSIRVHFLACYVSLPEGTPPKTNMEPKNGALEDDFPQTGDSSGSMLVYPEGSFYFDFRWGFSSSGTEDTGGSVLWTQRRWGCTRHPYASSRARDGGNIPLPGPEIPGVQLEILIIQANSSSEKSLHEKHVAMEMRSQKKNRLSKK